MLNPAELLDSFSGANQDAAYNEKMMHPIPDVPSVNRIEYILEHCKDRNVADFGCASGKLHEKIKTVAMSVYGFDKNQPADCIIDFDSPEGWNFTTEFPIDIYVCGEILEHLINPGWFLGNLKKAMEKNSKSTALITTPNAFSAAAYRNVINGIECVNKDHKFWPSFFTLKTMLETCGFIVTDFKWYGGVPRFSEGLVFLVE